MSVVKEVGIIKRLNLIGKKFGLLTVVGEAEDYIKPKGQHLSQFYCNCECGKKNIIVLGSSLNTGVTKSCGCLQKKTCSKISDVLKKYNKYDLSNEYGIGYLDDGKIFYFDIEDYDKIKNYHWRSDQRNYIKTKSKNKIIFMHRLIMDVVGNNEVVIDHIKGENSTNDNRKSNLRIASHSQNSINKKRMKTNTSGYTGVWYDKKSKNWRAKITINKKIINLGSFTYIEDAINTRKEAEEKYFGEWSYNNSQNITVKE